MSTTSEPCAPCLSQCRDNDMHDDGFGIRLDGAAGRKLPHWEGAATTANQSSAVPDLCARAVVQCHQAAAGIPLSATAVRPPGTWRYSVEGLHPTCRATSAAVMVPDASIAFAALTWMAFNAGGRPPTRPRARLAASAVRVRSRRSSTSNCPRAAKMWRINRPVALTPDR